MSKEISQNSEYKHWAEFTATKIKLAQTNAAIKVNAEMLALYWEVGSSILEKQSLNGWGSKVIDLLAADLAKKFSKRFRFFSTEP